jgi:hypothetical protein
MPAGEAAQPCRPGLAMTGMYRVPERVIASRLGQAGARAWFPRVLAACPLRPAASLLRAAEPGALAAGGTR